MSNYIQKAYNPKTEEIEEATYMDDYFGRHQYGVKFPDGEVYREKEVKPYYEETDISKQHTEKSKKIKHTKVDEILIEFNEEMINGAVNDFGTEHHEDGFIPIVEKAKQQINKWALEKCLEVIGNDLDNYEIVGIKISDIINGILRQQREKARKEFYE